MHGWDSLTPLQQETSKLATELLLGDLAAKYSHGQTTLPIDNLLSLARSAIDLIADDNMDIRGINAPRVIAKAREWNHIELAGNEYRINASIMQYLTSGKA